MRKYLLASTCFVSLAAPAVAETTISNTVTGPVRTSTVKQGVADDILINSTGVVNGNASGGVIIDSNHKLNNQGSILIGNVSNLAAVDVAAGVTSGLTVSGKITVDEAFTPTDADNDGDLDGPFATGANRFGIRTNGAFTGNILIGSTGTITVVNDRRLEGDETVDLTFAGTLSSTLNDQVSEGDTSHTATMFSPPSTSVDMLFIPIPPMPTHATLSVRLGGR